MNVAPTASAASTRVSVVPTYDRHAQFAVGEHQIVVVEDHRVDDHIGSVRVDAGPDGSGVEQVEWLQRQRRIGMR